MVFSARLVFMGYEVELRRPEAVLVDLDGTLLDHGGQAAALEEVSLRWPGHTWDWIHVSC